jgi:hypothetical protein
MDTSNRVHWADVPFHEKDISSKKQKIYFLVDSRAVAGRLPFPAGLFSWVEGSQAFDF